MIARLGNVGAEPPAQRHSLAGGCDVDGAIGDKHAEDIVARPGKDARAADGDQPEQAAQHAFGGVHCPGPIVEQATFHEAEFSAGVGDIAVDRQARSRPEPEPGVAAEGQGKPGRLARYAGIRQPEFGFIAQDVQPRFPDLVITAGDPSKTVSLNYPGFIAPMVKAMQEMKVGTDARLEAVEKENAALRASLRAANDNCIELRKEVEDLKRAGGRR